MFRPPPKIFKSIIFRILSAVCALRSSNLDFLISQRNPIQIAEIKVSHEKPTRILFGGMPCFPDSFFLDLFLLLSSYFLIRFLSDIHAIPVLLLFIDIPIRI